MYSGNLGEMLNQKTQNQFPNLNRRFVTFGAKKIGSVQKISPILRVERFELKQVVFESSQVFVKVNFETEQEF